MDDDFEKKISEIQNSDGGFGFLGIKHMAQYHTKAGVSSLTSWVGFLDDVDEENIEKIPDYILSDTLEKDLDATISACVWGLKQSKYLPDNVSSGTALGALPEGQREGAFLKDWEDYKIVGSDGEPVYTKEMISSSQDGEQNELATAFWLIVKDICDEGEMLSPNWYRAKIIYEYFRDYPVPPENAFLIGELFKELCVKMAYEGELSAYYSTLSDNQKRRQKGASATKQKAEELREYCVKLFVEIAENVGPRIMLAPAEFQARELRKIALEKRPKDFVRSGKPYSVEWFLRHIVEDRRLDIVEMLENRRKQ